MVDTRPSESGSMSELFGEAFEDATSGELDRRFGILSDRRRRFVLLALAEESGAYTLRDLAERVVAWEEGKLPREVTEEERKRASVSLYHVHLPKLDDAGMIEYTETSMVAVRPATEIAEIAPIEAIERETR